MLNPMMRSVFPQYVIDRLEPTLSECARQGFTVGTVSTRRYKGVTIPASIYVSERNDEIESFIQKSFSNFLVPGGEVPEIEFTDNEDDCLFVMWYKEE